MVFTRTCQRARSSAACRTRLTIPAFATTEEWETRGSARRPTVEAATTILRESRCFIDFFAAGIRGRFRRSSSHPGSRSVVRTVAPHRTGVAGIRRTGPGPAPVTSATPPVTPKTSASAPAGSIVVTCASPRVATAQRRVPGPRRRTVAVRSRPHLGSRRACGPAVSVGTVCSLREPGSWCSPRRSVTAQCRPGASRTRLPRPSSRSRLAAPGRTRSSAPVRSRSAGGPRAAPGPECVDTCHELALATSGRLFVSVFRYDCPAFGEQQRFHQAVGRLSPDNRRCSVYCQHSS